MIANVHFRSSVCRDRSLHERKRFCDSQIVSSDFDSDCCGCRRKTLYAVGKEWTWRYQHCSFRRCKRHFEALRCFQQRRGQDSVCKEKGLGVIFRVYLFRAYLGSCWFVRISIACFTFQALQFFKLQEEAVKVVASRRFCHHASIFCMRLFDLNSSRWLPTATKSKYWQQENKCTFFGSQRSEIACRLRRLRLHGR